MCFGDVSLDSDLDFDEPQSSSFSKKRSFVWADSQEETRHERSPVKAPPPSRRRLMPPTPQQRSYPSIEETQWQKEMEVQRRNWSTRERKVIAALENHLDESDDMKVEIEELELLMGPEDSEVDQRFFLMNANSRH